VIGGHPQLSSVLKLWRDAAAISRQELRRAPKSRPWGAAKRFLTTPVAYAILPGHADTARFERFTADLRMTSDPPYQSSWSTKFAIGIEEIDAEHAMLFRCLDKLMISIHTGFGSDLITEALDGLSEYTRVHFKVEECVMRLVGYPDLAAHKSDHQFFADQLAGFRARTIDPEVARAMVAFLTEWLIKHIDSADRKYVAYFPSERIRAAVSPATGVQSGDPPDR
jgi:hemerythrin